MFSYGKKFQELWAQISQVVIYRDYIDMVNAIDDAQTGDEITKEDEVILMEALELFKRARRIKDDPDY